MSRAVVPLGTDYRIPEQGRIRLGVKTERAMKSIDTFRFTSLDECAIQALAEEYGGTVQPWTPQRSKESQWEVLTEASEIRVFLPPWCASQDKLLCRPHTRLRVILPEIRFGGIWRLESKGWNASKELPGMAQILEQLQAIGIVEGRLVLEKRTKVSGGKTKKFVVPRLITDTTPIQILKGSAQVYALEDTADSPIELDAVVEAEIVEEAWDIPPSGIKVKKNPTSTGPRYVKAD